MVYHVDSERCLNQSSVRLTRCMITRARRDNRVWGSGCRNPATLTERHCISAATYEHLRGWIFNKKFLETLKASEQSTQRGHCFAVKEAIRRTFKSYKESAAKKGVNHVGERVYRRVLGHKIFTKQRKDHCMCTTCLRSGWRGIWDGGQKTINMIDRCAQWEVTTDKNGKQIRHSPGKHLHARLKRLWDFLRLQINLHFDTTSEIGHHCLNLQLGSLAEPRFDNPCTHHENLSPPPPEETTKSSTCGGCSKRSRYHCKHCTLSFCKDHLVQNICKAEILPATFNTDFVCT